MDSYRTKSTISKNNFLGIAVEVLIFRQFLCRISIANSIGIDGNSETTSNDTRTSSGFSLIFDILSVTSFELETSYLFVLILFRQSLRKIDNCDPGESE